MMKSTNNSNEFTVKTIRLLRKAKWAIFLFILVAAHYFALNNIILLSKDMIYDDFSDKGLFPAPLYPPWTIPENAVTLKYNAADRVGGDFAVVYFPAQKPDALAGSYDPATSLDPWGRVSHYAPLVEFLCSVTICKMDFGYACFLNLLIQLGLFFLATFFVFKSLGIQKYYWMFLLFSDFCLFLTPVGLTWFESGQFSLYVAISYPLLMLGIEKKKAVLTAFSALFAYIKWVSLPFVFVALAIYILTSKNKKELQYSLFTTFLFGLIFVLLSLPFMNASILFVQRIIFQEVHSIPQGLSLAIFLPRFVVKSLPFALIIIGYVVARMGKSDFIYLVPFLVGAAAILLLYPTLAFDYSIPTILGFVPLMIFWTKRPGPDQPRARKLILLLFVLFIILASFSTSLTGSTLILIVVYLVFSIALMASPVILSRYLKKPALQELISEK